MVANCLLVDAIDSLNNHEEELYKFFGITNLWDAIHDIDDTIINFLAKFNVFVILREPGVGSSSGLHIIVKAYPDLHRSYADIPREDIMGCVKLQQPIKEVEAAHLGVNTRPSTNLTIIEPQVDKRPQTTEAERPAPLQTDTPTVIVEDSPSPEDEAVAIALEASRAAAELAAADAFLILPTTEAPPSGTLSPAQPQPIVQTLSDKEAEQRLETLLRERRRGDMLLSLAASMLLLTQKLIPLLLGNSNWWSPLNLYLSCRSILSSTRM